MKKLTLVLSILAASAALADPPTPPPKPNRWLPVGDACGGESGCTSNEVIIDLDDIVPDGNHIFTVDIGRFFTKANGRWSPVDDATGGVTIFREEIDCKHHTFMELSENDFGSGWEARPAWAAGWSAIDPSTQEALVEKWLCSRYHYKRRGSH